MGNNKQKRLKTPVTLHTLDPHDLNLSIDGMISLLQEWKAEGIKRGLTEIRINTYQNYGDVEIQILGTKTENDEEYKKRMNFEWEKRNNRLNSLLKKKKAIEQEIETLQK